MVTGDGVGRIDPKTRRALPAGIRYREDRKKYQVRAWAIGMNGEWRERSFYVSTLSEAKKVRAETQAQRFPDGSLTLIGWHARYWAVIADSIRPSTSRAYERAWRLRVRPWLGHVKLIVTTCPMPPMPGSMATTPIWPGRVRSMCSS